MKRIIYSIAIFAALFLFFSVSIFAEDTAEEYLGKFTEITGIDVEDVEGIGADAVFRELLLAITGQGSRIAAFLLFTLGGAGAISLASVLGGQKPVVTGVCAVVAAGIYKELYELILGVIEVLGTLSELFSALIPIMTGITLAGGGVSAASTEAFGMSLALRTVNGIAVPIMLPLVSVLFALSVAGVFESSAAVAITPRIRSAFMWVMGIATAVLLGVLSLQSVISGAKDSAMMRAAKYSATGLIPIVGGTVSATLGTLGAGLSYAKSIIGAGSVYVLVSVLSAPLILVLLYRMILSLTSGLLDFVGAPSGARLFSSMTSAIDALAALYAVSGILYIFEIIVFMKSGVAVL